MLRIFFSPRSLWPDQGLAIIRVMVGIFMIYHGSEVFEETKMNDYAKWLRDLNFPSPSLMAYLGKGTELVSGIFFTLGLFTRLAAIPLAVTMMIICFGLGQGKIFMDDQHPFLFALLALLFFFTGPGKWSLDQLFFGQSKMKTHL
jgi:uncharacterized membrane protein YphA (DoxX/SURF4 family)